jgi:hypothetical protein
MHYIFDKRAGSVLCVPNPDPNTMHYIFDTRAGSVLYVLNPDPNTTGQPLALRGRLSTL